MKKEISSVLLFMHIPKTAGTSLRKIIENQVLAKERLFIYSAEDKLDFVNFKNKDKLKLIFGHFNYADRLDTYLDRQYKFITFMRNPVEQVISNYYHLYNTFIKNKNKPKQKSFVNRKFLESLEAFVTNTRVANNLQTKYITGLTHNKQKLYPKKTLNLAKYHIDNYFDFVGVTENYNDSIKYICNKYGLNPEIKMLNVGRRPKSKDISSGT